VVNIKWIAYVQVVSLQWTWQLNNIEEF
jgi:hypothetical protein